MRQDVLDLIANAGREEAEVKLILSRKGFDGENGGVASPILPDGRMGSLPIPDGNSSVRFSDLHWDDLDLGTIVEDLTGGRVSANDGAHMTPTSIRDRYAETAGGRRCSAHQGQRKRIW